MCDFANQSWHVITCYKCFIFLTFVLNVCHPMDCVAAKPEYIIVQMRDIVLPWIKSENGPEVRGRKLMTAKCQKVCIFRSPS